MDYRGSRREVGVIAYRRTVRSRGLNNVGFFQGNGPLEDLGPTKHRSLSDKCVELGLLDLSILKFTSKSTGSGGT